MVTEVSDMAIKFRLQIISKRTSFENIFVKVKHSMSCRLYYPKWLPW